MSRFWHLMRDPRLPASFLSSFTPYISPLSHILNSSHSSSSRHNIPKRKKMLDSPVEALAFNYLSFGFLTLLNNLWTWLALLTAALSFWKIRSAGYTKPGTPVLSLPDPAAEALNEVPKVAAVCKHIAKDVDGARKGKFTVYYEDEDAQCSGESEGLVESEETQEREEVSESEWWERWERLLRLRNGVSENGWYTCQDLTALNGNVVRLWDGGLSFGSGSWSGSLTRESWCSSSCAYSSLVLKSNGVLLDIEYFGYF